MYELRRTLGALVLSVMLCAPACSRAPAPGRVEAVTTVPPPESRPERVGHAPHPGWAYVSGYWNLVNGHHVWVPGFWTVPPQGMHRWQPAYWYHDKGQGWVLVKGYWR